VRSLRIAGLVAALASLIASGRFWSAALTPTPPVFLPAPEPQRLFVSPAVVVAPPVRVAHLRKPRHEVRVPVVQAAAAPPRHVSIGPPLPLVLRPTKSPPTAAPSARPAPEPKHAPPPSAVSPAPQAPIAAPAPPVVTQQPAPQAPVAAPAPQPAVSDGSLTPASTPPPAPGPSPDTSPPASNTPPPAEPPPSDDETLPTRPGWGNGDENHDHTGPPGAQDGHGH
jgi:hypothetical protein